MTIQSSNSPEIEQYTSEPELARPAGAAQSTRKIRLGEELPIFCEKCGYALHDLKTASDRIGGNTLHAAADLSRSSSRL